MGIHSAYFVAAVKMRDMVPRRSAKVLSRGGEQSKVRIQGRVTAWGRNLHIGMETSCLAKGKSDGTGEDLLLLKPRCRDAGRRKGG